MGPISWKFSPNSKITSISWWSVSVSISVDLLRRKNSRFFVSNPNFRYGGTHQHDCRLLLAKQFGLLHLENVPFAKRFLEVHGRHKILLVFVLRMGIDGMHGIVGGILTFLSRHCDAKEEFPIRRRTRNDWHSSIVALFHYKRNDHCGEYVLFPVNAELLEQPVECVLWTNTLQIEIKVSSLLREEQEVNDLILMAKFPFQFPYVFAAAVHVDNFLDSIDIHMVRKWRNVLHEFDNQCNSSTTRALHLCAATGAHNLSAEEIMLFQTTTIGRRLGRRNDLHKYSQSINVMYQTQTNSTWRSFN